MKFTQQIFLVSMSVISVYFPAERDAFDALFDTAPEKLVIVRKVNGV